MPVITVEMWRGRSLEQKRLLAQGITEQFVKIGTPAGRVQIIFKDNDKQDWAIGGTLASETPDK